MRLFLLSLCLVSFLCACNGNANKHLEKLIRAEVLSENRGIATLQASYMLTFVHFEENYILSDEFYVQRDIASVDYGFELDEKSIRVLDVDGAKTLSVRLGKGRVLAVDRKNSALPQTTHKGYVPKNAKTGETINVDEKMNQELEELERIYGEKNLKLARENAKNFFRIIAAKYGLELDFE